MKTIIGRIDKADLPEFHLSNIDVKIDSGAYTSTIHCTNIKEKSIKNKSELSFTLLDPNHPLYNNKTFKTKNYASKIVKSSNGISEKRFLIQTEIIIFNTKQTIFLTLSKRQNMKYPILLGRKFLNKKFLIDTTKKNLSYKQKQMD